VATSEAGQRQLWLTRRPARMAGLSGRVNYSKWVSKRFGLALRQAMGGGAH